MQVKRKTYVAPGGLFTITDSELAYRTMLRVTRGGVGYNIVDSGPGNRDVQYSPVGSITFENVFAGGTSVGEVVQYEKVTIIYK